MSCDNCIDLQTRIDKLENELQKHQWIIKCTCRQKQRNAQPGTHHDMRCLNYIGPLTHVMKLTKLNETFGGFDYDCTCGGWFRQGGLAGHGDGTEKAEVICPNINETWRGPKND